jgi:hypothetical protein
LRGGRRNVLVEVVFLVGFMVGLGAVQETEPLFFL